MDDEKQDKSEVEQDERFPSGPWTGFFLQELLPPGKHWMELDLKFKTGSISGDGRDRVGAFHVSGKYDVADGRCFLCKTYVGRHDVLYSGFNEGKGIWGTWDLNDPPWHFKGGFHIWPRGQGSGAGQAISESAEIPEPEAELVGASAAPAAPAGRTRRKKRS